MKPRADTILAAFVVAIFASFLTALAVLLVKTLAVSTFKVRFIGDLIINIYILFFFSGFVFFKGASVAAWLIYRHDISWGYKVTMGQILPIFFLSFGMAIVVYFAIYFFAISQSQLLAYLENPPIP